MSIEEHAQNILTAREQCDDYNYTEYVKENARAILDALKWVPVTDRLSYDESLVMVRFADGKECKSWWHYGYDGWVLDDDHDSAVVAWRELV
jgi:hypothetical protein